MVAKKAAEVFGLGFGEFGGGVDEGVVTEPSFGAGEEFRGDVFEVHHRGGALGLARGNAGSGLGWETFGEEKGNAGAKGFWAFWEQRRWGVGVLGAKGGAELWGGWGGIFA